MSHTPSLLTAAAADALWAAAEVEAEVEAEAEAAGSAAAGCWWGNGVSVGGCRGLPLVSTGMGGAAEVPGGSEVVGGSGGARRARRASETAAKGGMMPACAAHAA